MNKRIHKLLIANRGEIACRVIATCQRLGIKTVAVFSDVDAQALHVEMADEAVHIGPAPAAESYLVADKIIAAAKLTGADAIHPGYGFLSENPEFSEACDKNDIIFIGPSAASMRAMALKGSAKHLMEEAGVATVPGYHGDDQSIETLLSEAQRIGFPVLIKAVAGGGGKGMRKVFAATDMEAAIQGARREGENSFGNGKLLIEKLIEMPRHIEIQVFGDTDDNVVHLFERDCSLQRRHQKVVEEAPAPGMSETMRSAMGSAAVRAAEAISYVGAGTVEFIVDVSAGLKDAPFYFMEMNTRLQVEHPVTEMITGQDLVEWQIRVAEGHPLPLSQDELEAMLDGHAVEVRLYAEDPYNGFMPTVGVIGHLDPFADVIAGGRIDAGFGAGDRISVHYDPMIGKLIAWGEDRAQAIDTLINLLADTPVTGIVTNRDFLLRILKHQAFAAGEVHTGFIDLHTEALLAPEQITPTDYALAGFAIVAARQHKLAAIDPWDRVNNFRLNLRATEKLWFDTGDGKTLTVEMQEDDHNFSAVVDGVSFEAKDVEARGGILTLTRNSLRQRIFIDVDEHLVTTVQSGRTLKLERHARDGGGDGETDGPGIVASPMPGKILEVKVSNGAPVKRGQPIIVMEAMKMEQTITAPKDGIINALNLAVGDQVSDGAVLFCVDDAES